VSGPLDRTGDDFGGGWDNHAELVAGRWVDRTPRRPDTEPQLLREAALLPWLAPLLPLPVPVPRIVSEVPLTVRHAYLEGGRCPGTSAAHGAALGEFLRALHAVDPKEAVRHGARDAASSRAELLDNLGRMTREVLPLLPARLGAAGQALLERLAAPLASPCLVHGDLGPEHIRVTGDRVGGVIDWGDSCVADPALDLAWTVLGSEPAFSEALVATYRPGDDVLARARDWHLLGPWHEVLYGLGSGGSAFVESGLAGAVDRLERLSPG
jgi:aminoglycoside phosphotransferase (APT) family kinase protein